MTQEGEERARFARDAFEARERLLIELRLLLRERNLLLQRIHRMTSDDNLPLGIRLSAITRWTEPWGQAGRTENTK